MYPFNGYVLLFSRNIYFLLQSWDFLFMRLKRWHKKIIYDKWKPSSLCVFTSLGVCKLLVTCFSAQVAVTYFSALGETHIFSFAAVNRFGSRGPGRTFVSDTSPKSIDREGLERRAGTRQIFSPRLPQVTCFPALGDGWLQAVFFEY